MLSIVPLTDAGTSRSGRQPPPLIALGGRNLWLRGCWTETADGEDVVPPPVPLEPR